MDALRSHANCKRAELYARADFYAWKARLGFPVAGRNPVTGEPLRSWDPVERQIGRTAHKAMARACYDAARAFRNPLP